MNALNPGLHEIYLYTTSDDFITIDGNSVSPQSTLTKRSRSREGTRGQHIPFLQEWNLDLKFIDPLAYDWLRQAGKVRMIIHTFNGYFLWNDPSDVQKDLDIYLDPSAEDYPHNLQLRYMAESPIIGDDVSFFGHWGGDGDVSDGWENPSGTVTFDGNLQSFSTDIRSIDPLERVLITGATRFTAPQGMKIRLEAEWVKVDSDATVSMQIIRSNNGTADSTTVQAVVTEPGVFSVEATITSATDTFRAQFINVSPGGGGTAEIRNVKLYPVWT